MISGRLGKMQVGRLREVVIGETFPLFSEKVFTILRQHVENSEDIEEAKKLVFHDLTSLYSALTAESVLEVGDSDDAGSAHDITFDGFQQGKIEKYVAEAVDLYDKISTLGKSEIQKTYIAVIRNHLSRKKEKRTELGRRHDQSAFFNEPESDADWEHWNTRVVWEPNEAVALSFGKDPRVVNETSLSAYVSPAGSPFRDEYLSRLDNLHRSIAAKKIFTSSLNRKTFSAWLKRNQIGVPEELSTISKSYDSKIHGNTLHKLYGSVLGLVITNYGYDILNLEKDGQREIVQRIIDDLGVVGFKITYTTFNGYLEEARKWASQETSHQLLKHAHEKNRSAIKGS